ncbi:hypothetical protein [Mycolicibacterium phlei]|uniref:hypothetical protein n=1 Tax=Mycolicibacterium phlei TaxID=1771 RepID=UPI00025AF466|nr:hypothetical protein [Mycolicibacterium phlei]EID16757.1 peptidase S15 [Mycolicibacterium phlei RIVM601174]MBF4190690.1 peptidase S15 [Mycolicibacterium phlei]
MGSAKYIGRVGALAVGLGVGVAIAAGGNGIAFADDTDSNDSTGTTSSESDTSSSDSDSESSSSTSVGATDNDTAGTPKLTSPGRFHRPTSKVTGGVRLVIDDQDLTQPRATTSRRSAESPRRSPKSTVTPDDESLTDIDDSPSTKGAQREEATVEPLETVTPAEPASIPDLSVAETAVTIETTVPEPLSPPPATATTTVAAVPIDILTPRFGRTGPFQPAGPTPAAALKVAAVRRLLDEAVAENDPRQSGATTQTTTSAPGAAAVGSTAGDVFDLPDNATPFQSFVGPDGTLYQLALTSQIGDDTDNPSQTIVTKIRPSGGEPVVFTIPGSSGPGLVAVADDGHAYVMTFDETNQVATITTITPSDETSSTDIDRQPMDWRIGPDGRVYVAAYRPVYDAELDMELPATAIIAVGPDGRDDVVVVAGAPPTSGSLTIAPDGTLHLVTSVINPFITVVTTITPSGQSEEAVAGMPAGRVMLGADGAAYLTTYTVDLAENTGLTTIYRLGDTTPIAAVEGAPIADGLTVGADGTVYQTTYTLDESGMIGQATVTVIREGSTSSTTVDGIPTAGVVVGPDGTAFQVTVDQESDITRVTAISPSGEVVTSTTPGSPAGRTVVVAADGTAYLLVAENAPDPDDPDTTVTVSVKVLQITATGATEIVFTNFAPVGEIVIGADGRAYLAGMRLKGDIAEPTLADIETVVMVLGDGESTTVSTIDGFTVGNLAVTPDNKGWLVTLTAGGDGLDSRAWLITLAASDPGDPTDPEDPTDPDNPGGGGSPSFIRQVQQFIQTLVAVPAQIARAAFDWFEQITLTTVRLINDLIDAAVTALDEVIVNLRRLL